MTGTAQIWSVIIATEGHLEHDPGTSYIHWTFGLALDAALQVVSAVEQEADDALDDCGCEASDLDGEIRHECSGYPIVSAFVCLDADSGKSVEKPRFHIASAPRDGSVIVVGHPEVEEAIVRWDEDCANHFVGNYPGIWVRIDRSATWMDHPDCGPSYWRPA